MAAWPDLTDYHEALQQPRRSFADPALQGAAIEQDRFGMPKPATGANAVVYKATFKKDVWAVRCFLRPVSDHAERYAAISAHLQKTKLSHATRFHWLKDGIRVRGGAYPIVKMEWVQGALLDRHVEATLGRPKELADLRGRWRTLVEDLERAKIAHGDLQHGNVVVDGKKLLVIDYDGMWVPALSGRKATETGHRAYQHPRRSEAHYGAWLDRFSALVVYVSLAALEKEPKLWDEYYTGDNLLFVREDFLEPARSQIWGHLASLGPEVKRLAGALAACAGRDPKDVPRLEDVAEATGRVKAVELAAAAPPRKKRAWGAKPAGSPLELAPAWKTVWARPGKRVETRWKKVVRDGPVEVKKKVQVLTLDPWRAGAAAAAGIAAGAALAALLSPALGLAAAGGGLAATRWFTRRREVEVRWTEIRPVAQQEKEQHETVVPGLKSAAMALAVAPDARQLVAVSKLGECGTWDLPDGGWRPFGIRLPPFELAALARANPRAVLATTTAATVWELAKGKRWDHRVDAAARVTAAAIAPDGARIALGHSQGLVRVLEAEGGRVVAEVSGLGARVSALAFSADGQLVAVGTGTGAVSVFRVSGRAEKLGDDRAPGPPITAAAVAGNGQAFAFGDEGGGVVILGKDAKRLALATLAGRGVRALAFCGDGVAALAAGCGDGTVRVVDPAKGAVVASHAVATAAVVSLSWAREKAALAAGSAAGQVALLGVDED
ncbi:MAG TPA: hypothetical protein VFL83_01330 [Anaeromyxobacter sp.]|nr:hypothetical protein [Anaeromyxobacter sp.]